MKHKKPDQLVMPEVVSEWDIFRKLMREIGAKGGAVCSPKQTESRRRIITEYNKQKKKEKNEKEKN